MYNYLFHYNPHQMLWYAFLREDKEKYFNGELKNPLHSKNIMVLIQEVQKLTK